MDLVDNDNKAFAAMCVVFQIILLSIVTTHLAATHLIGCFAHHADGFLKKLLRRIERVVREHGPMLILMVYLGYHTTIFEQYPLAKALVWLTYVVIFCMDDLTTPLNARVLQQPTCQACSRQRIGTQNTI